LVDLEFYKNCISFQKEYSKGLKYFNTVQTNGTLITKDWVKFFKDNDFRVSISLDGPKHINDKISSKS